MFIEEFGLVAHNELDGIRDRHLESYKNYLTALSGVLTEELILSRPLSISAHEQVAFRSVQLQSQLVSNVSSFKTDVFAIVNRAIAHFPQSRMDLPLYNFATVLSEEVISGVSDIARRDQLTVARLAVEVRMGVNLTNIPPTQYIQDRMTTFDRAGRRWKSERFVQVLLHSSLYRAYNESLIYVAKNAGTESFRVNYPEQMNRDPVDFHYGDLQREGFQDSLLHANSQGLVAINT